MSTKQSVSLVGLLLVVALLATGCGPASPAALTDVEVLEVARNVLAAIDAGDYPAFTRDFSAEMLAAFTESQFTELGDLLHSTSGNFVASGEASLSNKQGYAIYRIICAYELEDVVVTIVFKIDGTQVEGLFFDSPNLRAASE